MALIDRIERALVIAPHPDDEVLGCGGTIARLADRGAAVDVAIVTRGAPPRFDAAQVAAVRAEAEAAHALLGVANSHFMEFPAAELDRVAQGTLGSALSELVAAVAPDTLFLPFVGDLHFDHQLVFTAGMVAARPRGAKFPARVYAYETVSETNWYAPGVTPGFVPNVFVDITATLQRKLDAFTRYASQVQAFPNERSVDALRALAQVRGATVYARAAEAFILIREAG